jgi:hypothetical protein
VRCLPFSPGDAVQLRHGDDGYLLRWVYPPVLPPARLHLRWSTAALFAFGCSLAVHSLALVGVALAMPAEQLIVEPEQPPRRVHVRLAAPKLEQLKPLPKVPPKPAANRRPCPSRSKTAASTRPASDPRSPYGALPRRRRAAEAVSAAPRSASSPPSPPSAAARRAPR